MHYRMVQGILERPLIQFMLLKKATMPSLFIFNLSDGVKQTRVKSASTNQYR